MDGEAVANEEKELEAAKGKLKIKADDLTVLEDVQEMEAPDLGGWELDGTNLYADL